jgi:transcriptional regulator with XRE-family HTH domain
VAAVTQQALFLPDQPLANIMQVGPVIRDIRRKRGLTLVQVAQGGNVSPSHLSLIEREAREPSLAVLNSIAKALDVPVTVLVLLAARRAGEPEFQNELYVRLEAALNTLLALSPDREHTSV